MINKNIAWTLCYRDILYHKTLKNKDGSSVRCRVNGQLKTWKTRPDDFRLPVKYGLRVCFYITPVNAADWTIDKNYELATQT